MASAGRLQAAAGGNTTMHLAEGVRPMWLGFPVEFVEVMNATLNPQTSTDGLAYFGNMAQTTVFGNRRGIISQVLRELYAATLQTGYIFTQRIDLVITEPGTASVCGSMVMLSTPGS
jgi:HK97 family phage major capsid protein